MTYAEKLKDPRWQRKRLEVFERDGFKCMDCYDATSELQVHHLVYRFGLEPWEYDNADLRTLCRPCHQMVSEATKEAKALLQEIARLDLNMDEVVGWLRGRDLDNRWFRAGPTHGPDPVVTIKNWGEALGIIQFFRPEDFPVFCGPTPESFKDGFPVTVARNEIMGLIASWVSVAIAHQDAKILGASLYPQWVSDRG